MTPNFPQMIDLLIDKTEDGLILWEITSRIDLFRAKIWNYYIEIEESKASIVGTHGCTIDEVSSTELPKIEVLFKEARRRAFKIDDVIDKMITCLQAHRIH